MQAIKCELCGGGDLVKQDGMFVCQHCGTKYTLEEARKLLGTVKIDKTDVKDNNRILARRAMNNKDYEEALRYYDILLSEEPNNWEPYFFSAICRVMDSKDPENEERNVSKLNRILPSAIELIARYVENPDEQHNALRVILSALDSFVSASTRLAAAYYRENRKACDFASGWLYNKTEAYVALYETYQDAVSFYFPGAQDVLTQGNLSCRKYVTENRKSISRKARREINKRMK